ncbi:flagellar protein [Polymorphum gilvum]|uniref:Flagellin N-terminal domain-containing protein n=1 Tax=Polymorphum gilvum (strain LMG 25793 / CGMCC 1.9160 / SL003B-26A1) TaxID=991905 RepID=F2J424_POLGS|nr:flagellar protein [Polymorphum gilvum]ADZ69950.1 hypothetical protein SL003B_1522 [Polymorphum gilvum SL003B-26A1]
MAYGTITTSRTYLTQQLSKLSNSMTEKTAQLASGKKATTYGGIGNQRLLDLELTQKVTRIESYEQTITMAKLHIETLNLTLDRMEKLRIEAKDTMDLNNFELQSDGQTSTQATAEILLHEVISLLNAEIGGHYLFGGSDANTNPVLEVDQILHGRDGKAGLLTVLDEFAQANLGAGGMGRLDVSALTTVLDGFGDPLTSTFSVTEDGAHDFGFDISAVTSTLSNVTITGPLGGDPDGFDVEFSGQPVPGETISIELALPPDGRLVTVDLTASASAGGEGVFQIGNDLAETAANLRAAVTAALQEEAQTSLRAASDTWAADSFFDTFGGAEPMRVAGPPFDTATGLIAGGSATVAWYRGENTPTANARTDKTAVVDDNLRIGYGVRANEQGLADVVKTLATFVAADFSSGTATAENYYSALAGDLKSTLQPLGTDRSGIVGITTEIAVAYKTIGYTSDRHTLMKSSYLGTIDKIEGIDKETVAIELLQMQTNIEASYRATSIVLNLSLTNYI